MTTNVGDDFNIADGVLPNPPWIPRILAAGVGFSVKSNGATTINSGSSGYSVSQHAVKLSSDNMQIDILCGPVTGAARTLYMYLGCNTTGECVAISFDLTSQSITSTTDWWNATGTVQASTGALGYVAGDWLSLRRVGNVYAGLKNFVPISGLTWTDGSNVVPRDGSHRFICLGNFAQFSPAQYQTIDAFRARSLDGAVQINRSVQQASLR